MQFVKVAIDIIGTHDKFTELKKDKIVCVQNLKQTQTVQNVLYYNMQMRFLEFVRLDETRPIRPTMRPHDDEMIV